VLSLTDMPRTLALSLVTLLAFAAPAAAKTHGDLVRSHAQTGADVLKSAGSNRLVTYRSVGARGKDVTVSGTVAVPKGKAPKGGWPVITWGHGTTGIADACAPSRDGSDKLVSYAFPLFNKWLKDGYAVLRTDFEGLGTAGLHPYLNGNSEGRDMLDIVRAARKLDPRIGRRVIIAGHSQGGQAALFAAALAPKWTPELTVRGTVAFAPVSHLSEQLPLTRAITSPSPLTALATMIVRGIDIVDPSLDVPSLLGDKIKPVYPQVDHKCLTQLHPIFDSIAPSEIFRSDADLTPFAAALNRLDDPENLKIKGLVRIEQGTADTTVLPPFTDQLAQELPKKGAKVSYKKWDGVTHGGAVTDPKPSGDATAFITSRLK
jgi:pimeloyl-ACP methyl ester carboxylesterase